MSTSKEYKAVRNYILNELHLTKEDIIKNIEPLLEKHVKRYMVNTYGGDNQIENWIRCMVNDELKQRDHDFVRRACENVIRNHVLNELNIIVRSKSEKCTCENRVPSEEDKKKSTDGLYIIYKDGHVEPFTGEYTVLMDEPDRNLDIDNIMQIYNVLSFHKPQTQIIAIVHNPALIYKLSKLDCVNFIEMTEGYLNKISIFASN